MPWSPPAHVLDDDPTISPPPPPPPPSSALAPALSSGLAEVWANGSFSDCRLVPRSGEEFAAHRLVLSARSEHFRELLAPTASAVTAAAIRLSVDAERPLVEAALRHVYLEAPPPDGLSHEELLALRGLLIMNGE